MGLFSRKWVFMDHDALAKTRKQIAAGDLDKAEKTLLKAEPTPAVLDQLRRIASLRAHEAKRREDWAAVVRHLEGYEKYAAQHAAHCIEVVNQAPPEHTATDAKLLQKARGELSKK